jgi:hypothetical protein
MATDRVIAADVRDLIVGERSSCNQRPLIAISFTQELVAVDPDSYAGATTDF